MSTMKNALALAAANFGSGVLAFWLWRVSGINNQVGVQLPVTMIVGVTLVTIWFTRSGTRFGALSGRDHARIIGAAFLVLAAVFIPLHYLLTGYLTSFANLLALWLVQAAQNILGMILAEARLRERAEREENAGARATAD